MVGGLNVKDYDIKSLRESVAVVLQKNTLFSGTIASNLRWGNEKATDEEIKQACEIAQADSFISSFPDGYDTMLDEGGTNVSGGQKQRICIARALIKNPKIIILDDSTSAVDTHTDALIRAGLKKKLPGTTSFIVAERILSVKDCDTILVMDNGKVVGKGTNDELMKSSKIYNELCTSQLGGGDFDARS
jgi:ATP-binding cassette subfamily B protein